MARKMALQRVRAFPSPTERMRLIACRAALRESLIYAMVLRDTDPDAAGAQIAALVTEYGMFEIDRMLDRITRQFQRPSLEVAEEAWLYNEYVTLHQRFGGTRPLLSPPELEALRYERSILSLRPELEGRPLTDDEQARLAELTDLTLGDADLWDDITPENPPSQAEAQRPSRNDPCWCGSGRKYKHCHLRQDQAA